MSLVTNQQLLGIVSGLVNKLALYREYVLHYVCVVRLRMLLLTREISFVDCLTAWVPVGVHGELVLLLHRSKVIHKYSM